MKIRTPYTEPYTPEEAAELAAAMKETEARMRANTAQAMDEQFARAWTDPDDQPLSSALPVTTSPKNPK